MRAESENLQPYHGAISKALKETLKSYEFKTADIENDGILDTRRKTITIKEGLGEKETLQILINQVAAALVLGRNRDKFQGLKADNLPDIPAIEITAVTDIVSRRLGFESFNVQEPDFSKMPDGDIDKFANNLGLIRSVSQRMVMAIDNALEEALTQEKLAGETGLDPEAPSIDAEPQEKSRTTVKTTTKTKVKAEAEMA